jgi:hypothetical protein
MIAIMRLETTGMSLMPAPIHVMTAFVTLMTAPASSMTAIMRLETTGMSLMPAPIHVMTTFVTLMTAPASSMIAIMRLETTGMSFMPAPIHVINGPMSQMIAVMSLEDGVMKPAAAFIHVDRCPKREKTAVLRLAIAVIHVVGAPDSLGVTSLGQMNAPNALDTPRVSPTGPIRRHKPPKQANQENRRTASTRAGAAGGRAVTK